jgi:gp16 family phage-associated protein
MKPKTPDSVRAEFYRKGITFNEWAIRHGFKYFNVIAVMNGRTKCRRGESHQIAIALGLKQPETEAV